VGLVERQVASPSPWRQPGRCVWTHTDGYAAFLISSIHNIRQYLAYRRARVMDTLSLPNCPRISR
jgi:hypothetical protein